MKNKLSKKILSDMYNKQDMSSYEIAKHFGCSSNGYSYDNIQWVHRELNMMKRKLSTDRFLFLCKKVAEHERGKNVKHSRST